MTRKDYILIADALRAAKPGVGAPLPAFTQWFYDVGTISNVLADANPHFDRVEFDAACGR